MRAWRGFLEAHARVIAVLEDENGEPLNVGRKTRTIPPSIRRALHARDKEGCRYAETGESSGADIFFLLDGKGVTTAVSYCEFKEEGKSVGGATKVAAKCHEEGSEETTPTEMTLTPDSGGYTVGLPDGTRWGPLMRSKS